MSEEVGMCGRSEMTRRVCVCERGAEGVARGERRKNVFSECPVRGMSVSDCDGVSRDVSNRPWEVEE